jgi:acyl carrier protein
MTTQEKIFTFITTSLNPNGQLVYDPTQNLLDSGTIDSLAMIDLVVYLEDTFGISVATDDLIPENFSTLDSIAAYVARSTSVVA